MIEQFQIPKDIADNIEKLFFYDECIFWTIRSETVSKENQVFFQKHYKFENKIADFNIVEKVFFHTRAHRKHKDIVLMQDDFACQKIKPLQDYIAINVIKQPVQVSRVLFNAFFYSSVENSIAHPHLDAQMHDDLSLTCIYYVNDSTGDTVLFDNNTNVIKRISPKKGTGVIFNSNMLHAGCYPNDENTPRVVVNFIFKYI